MPSATPPPITLVVMAAGLGRRFGGNKPIAPVGPSGESLLEYTLHDAALVGFGRVVLVIRPEIEGFLRTRLGRLGTAAIAARYVVQELDDLPAGFALPAGRGKPWGTGHAVLSARHAIQGPFAVVNGDDFYGRGSLRVMADFLRSACDDQRYRYALVGFPLENTLSEHGCVGRGICAVASDGTLSGITERTRIRRRHDAAEYALAEGAWQPIPRGTVVSMNLWGFTPSMMGELARQFPEFLRTMADAREDEFFLPAVVGSLVEAGRASVCVLATDDRWLGITYPEDVSGVTAAIQGLVARGEYPTCLWG